MSNSDAARIKRKMLGIRLRSARVQVGLGLEASAQHLNLSPDRLNQYELGGAETSLPELEAMAQLYRVPVSYFWSNGLVKEPDIKANIGQRIPIRQKIIGVQIRQMREEAGQTRASVAEALACSEETVVGYELGKQAIPFSQMETLASLFDVPLSRFLEAVGKEDAAQPSPAPAAGVKEPVAPAPAQKEALPATGLVPFPEGMDWLSDAPDDILEFLSDPSSLLYLRLSMRLHGLSTDTLRALAEGILDITY
jgi:transcriptional regulator with XRE-family HTH domain